MKQVAEVADRPLSDLQGGVVMADHVAHATIECSAADCTRAFLTTEAMLDHAALLHSSDAEAAREFDTKQRKTAAKQGQAQKDGSFPIKNQQDLKNAIQALGRSKNKAATKAHIIKRAKALGLTKLLPKGWTVSTEKAHEHGVLTCPEEACNRSFLSESALFEHADAVHTFDDIRAMVSEAVRDAFNRDGDYQASPVVPGIWAWVQDIADDWVVFTLESGGESKTLQASYSIIDNKVVLGSPFEVVRRTIYDPVEGN